MARRHVRRTRAFALVGVLLSSLPVSAQAPTGNTQTGNAQTGNAQAGAAANTAQSEAGATALPPAAAPAQTATPAPPQASPTLANACQALRWKLDGASASATEEADYAPAWAPILDEIAGCAKVAAFSTGCLNIRGHYDAIEFKGGQEVVGGEKSAQRLRAASRAMRVAEELRARGAADDVLRWNLAPYEFATYRGASVEFVPNCRPEVVNEIADEVARRIQAPQAGAATPEPTTTGTNPPAPAQEAMPPEPAPAPAEPADPVYLTYEGGLLLGFLVGFEDWSADRVFVPALQVGAGVRYAGWYGRLNLSGQTGIAREQRFGVGASLALGYRHSDLLQGGLIGSYQVSTKRAFEPVLDSYLALGVEARQCVLELGAFELCIWETARLGSYTVRAEVDRGDILRIPVQHRPALGLAAGAVLTGEVEL